MSLAQERIAPPRWSNAAIGDAAFRTLADLVERETGIVLSEAKKALAISRLSPRLRRLGMRSFDEYCAVLRGCNGPSELQEAILLLTTNVTRFFREAHHFDVLRTDVLPDLVARARAGGRVRIWSAGSSSGEEAYSIALTLLSAFPEAPETDFRILASDIDRNMLAKGRSGRYHLTSDDLQVHPLLAREMAPVPGEAELFDVPQKARDLVQFAELNLQNPWPMKGKFDVIFCRNVVIYFSMVTQQSLWPRFADALMPGGYLFIGHSERVTGPALPRLRSCGVTLYKHIQSEEMR